MACGSGWTFPSIVGDYAFINVYGTAALGAAQAEFAMKQGWKKAYNLSSTEYFYGKNIGDTFAARYKQLGGKIVGTGFYKFADTDFRALATQIAAQKPQVVTSTIVLPGSTTFLKQLRAAGYKGPVLGADSFDAERDAGRRKRPQQRLVHDARLPDRLRGRRRSSQRSRRTPARHPTERSSRPAATSRC